MPVQLESRFWDKGSEIQKFAAFYIIAPIHQMLSMADSFGLKSQILKWQLVVVIVFVEV